MNSTPRKGTPLAERDPQTLGELGVPTIPELGSMVRRIGTPAVATGLWEPMGAAK